MAGTEPQPSLFAVPVRPLDPSSLSNSRLHVPAPVSPSEFTHEGLGQQKASGPERQRGSREDMLRWRDRASVFLAPDPGSWMDPQEQEQERGTGRRGVTRKVVATAGRRRHALATAPASGAASAAVW